MKTEEIVKALRCTATVHVGDDTECESCPYFSETPVPEDEVWQVPEDFYYSCDPDKICFDAADRLEYLVKLLSQWIDVEDWVVKEGST